MWIPVWAPLRWRRWNRTNVPPFWRAVAAAGLLAGLLLLHDRTAVMAFPSLATHLQSNGAPPGCTELITNGGFETVGESWVIASSVRPAEYTNMVVHQGQRAMRLGVVDLPNIESESAVAQTVTLPDNASSIVLSFHHYPLYDDTPGPGDLQFVDLFNAFSNQFVGRALSEQSNARQWLFKQYDLTVLAGQQVRLVLAVNNDGIEGRTAMYVDDVSILACGATVTPTELPTATPTTAATATAPPLTLTPTSTATPAPTMPPATATMPPPFMCPDGATPTDLIVDGGFESGSAWIFGEDPVPPRYTSEQVFSGARAVLLGNPPDTGAANQVTYSSIRQLVTIPHDAVSAQLRWQRFPRSQETPSDAPGRQQDRQDVIALSAQLQTIDILQRERRDDGGWSEDTFHFPIDFFRGRRIYIYFNAFNDGNGARTWIFLDDVRLLVCLPSTAAHPPAPKPTPYTAPTIVGKTAAGAPPIVVLTAAVVPASTQSPASTLIPPTPTEALAAPAATATPTLLPITTLPATSPSAVAPNLRIITPGTPPRLATPQATAPPATPPPTAIRPTETASAVKPVATTAIAPSNVSSGPPSDRSSGAAPDETSLFDRLGTVAVLIFILAIIGLLSLGVTQVVRAAAPASARSNGKSQQ